MKQGLLTVTKQFEIACEIARSPAMHHACIEDHRPPHGNGSPRMRQMTPEEVARRSIEVACRLFEIGESCDLLSFAHIEGAADPNGIKP